MFSWNIVFHLQLWSWLVSLELKLSLSQSHKSFLDIILLIGTTSYSAYLIEPLQSNLDNDRFI